MVIEIHQFSRLVARRPRGYRRAHLASVLTALFRSGRGTRRVASWRSGPVGKQVGKHIGGYNGFSIDITPGIKTGDNVVAVQLNNK
jgi:hypothetical protein